MNLTNGTHKIFFSNGKLFLDNIQIAGEGVTPNKDVTFEFQVNRPSEVEEVPISNKDPSVLEVCVSDSVAGKDMGPGQR